MLNPFHFVNNKYLVLQIEVNGAQIVAFFDVFKRLKREFRDKEVLL